MSYGAGLNLPASWDIHLEYQPRERMKMKIQTKAKCVECSRIFDLLDEGQASEWYYGHDCEVE